MHKHINPLGLKITGSECFDFESSPDAEGGGCCRGNGRQRACTRAITTQKHSIALINNVTNTKAMQSCRRVYVYLHVVWGRGCKPNPLPHAGNTNIQGPFCFTYAHLTAKDSIFFFLLSFLPTVVQLAPGRHPECSRWQNRCSTNLQSRAFCKPLVLWQLTLTRCLSLPDGGVYPPHKRSQSRGPERDAVRAKEITKVCLRKSPKSDRWLPSSERSAWITICTWTGRGTGRNPKAVFLHKAAVSHCWRLPSVIVIRLSLRKTYEK